jgi:hypothetical protein
LRRRRAGIRASRDRRTARQRKQPRGPIESHCSPEQRCLADLSTLSRRVALLVRNVGEFTAGMIRIAEPSEPDYIEQSLNGITGAEDAETTKLVLALVAQEIRWRPDKLDLLPR